LLFPIIIISCGFVDLRPIRCSIEPDTTDSVLTDSYSPVIIKFDTEMEKYDVENILQVTSVTGVMTGDISWNGNDLYFTPVSGWTAGIRYTLGLSGTVRSIDGRDLRLQRYISFYAINKNEPPLLEWYFPANGTSTGTCDVVPEFYFSRSMDRLTVESAFTLEGIGNKTFEWSDDDKRLKIFIDKALSPWVSYRWNLRDSAKSIDGVPLPKTYSGYFTTNLDQTLPFVTGVFPVLNSDGSWYPTGAAIETGLAPGEGIAIEFNKPMGENVLRSVRIEPSVTGRTELLSEKSIIYIFTKDPEPQTIYTLIVSAETRDNEGLKLGADYKINFTPDIPFLDILSFSTGNVSITENIVSNSVIPVQITPGTGELVFSIRFSLPFTLEEKQNTAQKIILTSFFPRTLAPVALQFVSWNFDDRLFMRWEGLNTGSIEIPHYYKLTIPGGKTGINNGMGMYFKEDIVLYLEAVNEI
jgi:hypothetical protein